MLLCCWCVLLFLYIFSHFFLMFFEHFTLSILLLLSYTYINFIYFDRWLLCAIAHTASYTHTVPRELATTSLLHTFYIDIIIIVDIFAVVVIVDGDGDDDSGKYCLHLCILFIIPHEIPWIKVYIFVEQKKGRQRKKTISCLCNFFLRSLQAPICVLIRFSLEAFYLERRFFPDDNASRDSEKKKY